MEREFMVERIVEFLRHTPDKSVEYVYWFLIREEEQTRNAKTQAD